MYNLLVSKQDLNSFCSTWFSSALSSTFKLIYLEDNVAHSPDNTICVTNHLNKTQWTRPFVDAGYKLIVDHFWDSNLLQTSQVINNSLIIRNKNWIWYNESLWYSHLGYDQYTPNKNYSKAFLMLMRLAHTHRDSLFDGLTNTLDSALYSYVDRNIQIAGDIDVNHGNYQRYFNPQWYNSTSFSVVAESNISRPTFISEKTFKPIAYYQPMVIWGSPGLLAYLHEQQFETFDHIIDESYDFIESPVARLEAVINVVNGLTDKFKQDSRLFDDAITKQKLEYNHNRFFDKQLILQKIKDEIISEILNFIE